MPPLIHPPIRRGGYLGQSAALNIINSEIIVAAGQGILKAGTILGQITANGKFVKVNKDATDGSQVGKVILFGRVDATSTEVRTVGTEIGAATVVEESLSTDSQGANQREASIADLARVGIKALRGETAKTPYPRPPMGFVFLVDSDGFYLTDADGTFLMEKA